MTILQWLNSLLEKINAINKSFPEIFLFLSISLTVGIFFIVLSRQNRTEVGNINTFLDSANGKLQVAIENANRIDSINLCHNLKVMYLYTNDLKKSKMYLATTFQRFFIVCYTIGIF